jgi:hypothetical protein
MIIGNYHDHKISPCIKFDDSAFICNKCGAFFYKDDFYNEILWDFDKNRSIGFPYKFINYSCDEIVLFKVL